MISSLVVSIEVIVMDGIWADMLTRPNLILMAILANKFSLLPTTTLSSLPCSCQLTTKPDQVSVETIWLLLIGSIRLPF